MPELIAILLLVGLVVCPILTVVYGIKTLAALCEVVRCHQDYAFHCAQSAEDTHPAQPLEGGPGAGVQPRLAARPGVYPPLDRTATNDRTASHVTSQTANG